MTDPFPLIEQIAENIKDTINLITKAAGFNQTLNAIRPKRSDFDKETWDDLTVLISQTTAEEVPGAMDCKRWDQQFFLACIVLDSKNAENSIDTRLNQVAADIFKKLMEDTSRGGLAIDTNFHSFVPFVVEDTSMSGIGIVISVDYRTKENNPYATG